ncbi:MAG: hypothetical protein GAK45_00558 [Pseudomonas citronellolis]|nr:MAG: hypothetical protein GAK45_00558 [Pseudomonas citronellolis]
MAEAPKSGATPIEGDGKRVLVILGTPRSGGFCHALAEAYAQGARSRDHVVRVLRLGDMAFDPVLRGGYDQGQTLEPDLLGAQREIHWAEHLALVYPVWWGGLPGLLQGFIDRAFQPGFAFRYRSPESREFEPLLSGRSADLLVSHDQTHWQYRLRQGAPAHRQMVRCILQPCGITTRHLEEFSPMRGSSEEQRQVWLKRAEQMGTQV